MSDQRGGQAVEDAVQAFWAAVAVLAEPELQDPDVDPASSAAEALRDLASHRAERELRMILRPNPEIVLALDEPSWTVSCFEIGNIAPSGLHESTSAYGAIEALTGCGVESHATSELVCSSGTGLQWVAVVRSDLGLVFQFPDLGNLTAANPRTATDAITLWRRHAHSMHQSLAEAPDPECDNVIDLVAFERTSENPARPALRTAIASGLDRSIERSASLSRRFASLASEVATRRTRGQPGSRQDHDEDRDIAELREHYEQRLDEQAAKIEQLEAELVRLRNRIEQATRTDHVPSG